MFPNKLQDNKKSMMLTLESYISTILVSRAAIVVAFFTNSLAFLAFFSKKNLLNYPFTCKFFSNLQKKIEIFFKILE